MKLEISRPNCNTVDISDVRYMELQGDTLLVVKKPNDFGGLGMPDYPAKIPMTGLNVTITPDKPKSSGISVGNR